MAIIPLMQKKVLFFIGTRPELIKLAPLVASMERRPDEFQVHVCLTSQHSEMLQQALRYFPIKAEHRAIARKGWERTHKGYNEVHVSQSILDALFSDVSADKYHWVNY